MNPRLRYLLPAPLAMAALLAGCRGATEEVPAPAPPTAMEPAPGRPFEGVPATGEAIFAWLNGERYRETWELLPGTSPMHEGTDGHGALLTTYTDPVAMEAIERAAPSMPPGAAIVVEDYLADSSLSTVSVMVRAHDPGDESGEWHFTRFGSAGEVEAWTMDACRGCHVLEPDFVFAWKVGTTLPIDSTGAVTGAGGGP